MGNTEPKHKMTKRSRGWCWTLNNYSETDYENIKMAIHSCTVEKWIIGKEVGKSGTPHLQGYLYFKSAKTFDVVKKINDKAHWEAAKGKPSHNYDYCSKDGDFECEGFGVKKVKFGGYSTLEEQIEKESSPMIDKDNLEDSVKEHLQRWIDEEYNDYEEQMLWSKIEEESDSEIE